MAAMKQFEVLQWASSFLKESNRETHIAEILLQHHLQLSRMEFFQNMQAIVPDEIKNAYVKDIRQHIETGKPIQHMIGMTNFYGRDFKVNGNVLIPRFETEELVETVLADLSDEAPVIVDVGTGSGVIAITLKLECPQATVYATDISKQALVVAKENADRLQADVHFSQGDFLAPLLENKIKPNIIVSNPPYIAHVERSTLSDTVKNFDPSLALFAEGDGLKAYQDIVKQSKNIETIKAFYFEIGHEQAKAVTEIIHKNYPESLVTTKQDIAGKDRIIIGKI